MKVPNPYLPADRQNIDEIPNEDDLCYFCGAESEGDFVNVAESPKDEFGIRVPVCLHCYKEEYVL